MVVGRRISRREFIGKPRSKVLRTPGIAPVSQGFGVPYPWAWKSELRDGRFGLGILEAAAKEDDDGQPETGEHEGGGFGRGAGRAGFAGTAGIAATGDGGVNRERADAAVGRLGRQEVAGVDLEIVGARVAAGPQNDGRFRRGNISLVIDPGDRALGQTAR